MQRFLIPDLPENSWHQVELNIKRSVFIASLAHAENSTKAKELIQALSEKYRDATHNCYAYRACAPNLTTQVGYSDDGEPHGTAGKPMLNLLLYQDIGEIVVVVTRYFGGIKLGTGGLQRAYSGALAEALQTLPTKEKVSFAQISLDLSYNQVNFLYKIIDKYDAKIVSENYGARVEVIVSLPEDKVADLQGNF